MTQDSAHALLLNQIAEALVKNEQPAQLDLSGLFKTSSQAVNVLYGVRSLLIERTPSKVLLNRADSADDFPYTVSCLAIYCVRLEFTGDISDDDRKILTQRKVLIIPFMNGLTLL